MDKDLNKIHALMRQLFGLVHRLEDEAIKASEFSDLSRAEISAIMAIGTGRPKTMTHVANILEINVSTLTTTINKLVKKGYVERLRDDKDRRIVKIGLSEKVLQQQWSGIPSWENCFVVLWSRWSRTNYDILYWL